MEMMSSSFDSKFDCRVSKWFDKRWQLVSAWMDATKQHKTLPISSFCGGHRVLAPSGQENVAADWNESGLQSETDEEGRRWRTERDEEKRGQKEGRKKLSITGDKTLFYPVPFLLGFPWFLLSFPLLPFFSSIFPSFSRWTEWVNQVERTGWKMRRVKGKTWEDQMEKGENEIGTSAKCLHHQLFRWVLHNWRWKAKLICFTSFHFCALWLVVYK